VNDIYSRLSFAERLCMKFVALFPKEPGIPHPPREGAGRNFDNSLRGFTARFPDFLVAIRGASILDYGCAMGHQCIGLSMQGALNVVGIDIQEKRIEAGRKLLREMNLDDRIALHTAVTPDMRGRFDVVVSLNCVEHFLDPLASLTEMKEVLKPGGRMFVTFGPVWYSAYGPHQHEFTRAPWVHLLFPESVVMKVRGIMMNDLGTRTYSQRWLNQISVKKFERLISALDMVVDYSKYDCSLGLSVLSKVPLIRELAVNNIACVLRKPPVQPAVGK
jgi:SAM-dependent methyltransferase